MVNEKPKWYVYKSVDIVVSSLWICGYVDNNNLWTTSLYMRTMVFK